MSRRDDGLGPPRVVGVLAGVAVTVLLLPLAGLVLRAPWSRLADLAADPTVRTALRLSLTASLVALGLSLLLGVPLAVVLARVPFRGRRVVRALVLLPMVLPPVVGGVALLAAYGRRGVVGGPLAALTGAAIPFSTAAVVLAATFVALPFLVVTVEGGVRQLDRGLEEAAATLGASRWTLLRRVVLPGLAPTLAAGAALAWARALGEFGATITFAGNLPGRTQTLPLLVALELARDPALAVLLRLALLGISVTGLALLRDRGLGGWRGGGDGAADGDA
ncbi:MAG: molybdate ABC transporter permease subunit [Nitriliruptoraceae bacterium]